MRDFTGIVKAGLEMGNKFLARLWPTGQTGEQAALMDQLKHWEEEHEKATRPDAPDPDHASFARERMRVVRARLQAIRGGKG